MKQWIMLKTFYHAPVKLTRSNQTDEKKKSNKLDKARMLLYLADVLIFLCTTFSDVSLKAAAAWA